MKGIRIFLLTLTATLIVSCGSKTEQKVEALKVQTETVGENAQDLSKCYVGEVEADESTAVSFTGMGALTQVVVTEGQHIQKGQTVAVMDPTQCQNALDAATAIMNQAKDGYDRMKILHDAQSVSEVDWVDVQSKVQQAKSSLEMAKKALADCTLKAPCSGVVGKVMVSAGQTALPSQTICSILNINKVKVKVSIPEKEIGDIKAATKTCISIESLGKTIDGGRVEKGVEADPLTRTYDIRINVANPGEQLLPGMVANVSIMTDETEEEVAVTTLPVRSIQQSADGRYFVWTVRDGKAHRTDVTIGETFGNRIEVLSGVNNGDKVIVGGYQKVSEGSGVVL